MTNIDEARAKEIAEDNIRKMFTFRLERVKDTSGLICYGIVDFSDYHVFWYSSGENMVGADSYLAVSKKDGSVKGFKCGE